jgi:hypothetical protein
MARVRLHAFSGRMHSDSMTCYQQCMLAWHQSKAHSWSAPPTYSDVDHLTCQLFSTSSQPTHLQAALCNDQVVGRSGAAAALRCLRPQHLAGVGPVELQRTRVQHTEQEANSGALWYARWCRQPPQYVAACVRVLHRAVGHQRQAVARVA